MSCFFDMLTFIFSWAYRAVFFWSLHTFIPLKRGLPLRILAFLVSSMFTGVVVYLNYLPNILLPLCEFFLYMIIFHQGKLAEKIMAVLIFYPVMISVNFLMQNIFSQIFFHVTGAPGDFGYGWTETEWMLSSILYALSRMIRFLVWIGVSLLLKTSLRQMQISLPMKLQLIVGLIIAVPTVACFTTIYFITDQPAIVYPLCVVVVFSNLSCILLVEYLHKSTQEMYHAQKLKMQQNYYAAKLKNEERIRSIYHDMKNYLLVMESKQNTEETRQMAETLRSQIVDYEDYVHTGNEFLDIILKDKAAKAREKQIDFSAMVDFHGIDFLEPLDISTIFGNAIDNAIEASENLPEYKRLITVKAERVRDMLIITVENNTAPGNHLVEGTTKKDHFVHGFGIPNIKKAVEKYGGQCSFQQEERMYRLKILIPIP